MLRLTTEKDAFDVDQTFATRALPVIDSLGDNHSYANPVTGADRSRPIINMRCGCVGDSGRRRYARVHGIRFPTPLQMIKSGNAEGGLG